MKTHCPWCKQLIEEGQQTVQLVGKAYGMPSVSVLVHHRCWLIIQRSPTATGYSIGGTVKREKKSG